MDYEGKAVVIVGNLSDGFDVVGPFDSWHEAAEWSDTCGRETWVVTMIAPKDF